MRTMKWPPRPVGGRIPMVEGSEATAVQIMQVLGDLRAQPFNGNISMGDITFGVQSVTRAQIENALTRLSRLISVDSVIRSDNDDGSVTYTIRFTDRESRTQGEVTING